MQNFYDAFETRKRSFISAFSICMIIPLIENNSGIWYTELSTENCLEYNLPLSALGPYKLGANRKYVQFTGI